MKLSKEDLLANLNSLNSSGMRTLNRYYLHVIDQRCCSKCLKIYDGIETNFHLKRYHDNGTKSFNVWCKSCFNERNRERINKCRCNPHEFIKVRFASYKSRAYLEDSPFNVSPEYLITQWDTQAGLCFYTAEPINFELVGKTGKHPHNQTPSLDRMDPSKGYTIGNVVWCSYAINRMKNDFNYDQFVQMCRHIALIRGKYDQQDI